MEITAAMVRDLRERTGAGMMECKKALEESGGDNEKAIEILRKRGAASAAKREGRQASEGLVHAYIHPGGKVGVLVEVNCETDFVARTQEFQDFVKDVAMQIAASSPQYVRRTEVPERVVAKEKEIYKAQAQASGKPEKVLDKIAEGMLQKFYSEACLLDQPFVKDPKRTIEDVLKELNAKVRENVVVRRFARFRLGEANSSEVGSGSAA